MDGLKQVIDNMREKLGGLSFNQKVMMGAVAVATILSITVFSLWIQKEDMKVLFTGLSPEDASVAMDELRKMNVDFELESGGTTILVPENMVDSMLIDLHSKGLGTDHQPGFEIFDEMKMGSITEFMQNVNYQRALEGELTRTIESLSSVQSARVHLVLPKPSIFNKDMAGATASVTLKLGRGARLADNQIGGIQSLVASSVQNLSVDDVRIHDITGRELSSAAQDSEVGRSETQLELRKEVERHLAAKAQRILDKALGPDKSIVQVSATLNFEKIESEREVFDPQGVVVRSEERSENNNPGSGTEEHSLTNNEINRTVEHVVSEVGNVTNLSVSVMVDGHYEPNEDGSEMVYVPLSENEISQFQRLVSGAVGLNTVRGDQIEFVNFEFQDQNTGVGTGLAPDWIGIGTQYGGKVLMVILFLILAMALKKNLSGLLASASGTSSAAAAGAAGGAGGGANDEHFEGIPEIDDQIMTDIQDYAAENPERVAEVVQSWIKEINLGNAMSAGAGE